MGHDTDSATLGVLPLIGGVQHYAWGDDTFIPRLLGSLNESGEPFAEYWMGAHPQLPSQVGQGDHQRSLDRLIEAAPEALLGADVASRFSRRLPYLFKVLSAAQPLSIQAHPSLAQAEAGFERENAAGVPLDAPHRNYRDANHKPELIVAVTDFWGLCGFRPMEDLRAILAATPEFAPLAGDFDGTPASLQRLYAAFMEADQADVDAVLGPLCERLEKENDERPLRKTDPAYWILRAHRTFSREGHHDRGILSVALLNLVHLRPGEALFLPAGLLHAYLEGTGIELMANSNNVLRGGLTPKHVDVPELLQTVTFAGAQPEILHPEPAGEPVASYPTQAPEFQLWRLDLERESTYAFETTSAVEIGLVLDADSPLTVTWKLDGQSGSLRRGRGECFLVPAGCTYRIESTSRALIYRATVPVTC